MCRPGMAIRNRRSGSTSSRPSNGFSPSSRAMYSGTTMLALLSWGSVRPRASGALGRGVEVPDGYPRAVLHGHPLDLARSQMLTRAEAHDRRDTDVDVVCFLVRRHDGLRGDRAVDGLGDLGEDLGVHPAPEGDEVGRLAGRVLRHRVAELLDRGVRVVG